MRIYPTVLLRAAAIALCATMTIVAPSSAAAQQVVVDGGAPNGEYGDDISGDYRSAAAFSVGAGGIQFDAIRFWGIYASGTPYAPDMYWQILSDVAGAPDLGAVAAMGHAVAAATERITDTPFSGYSSWQFDFGTGLQSLGAGTFWLVLHEGMPDPASSDYYTYSGLMWEMTDVGTPFQVNAISDVPDDPAIPVWGQLADQGLAFQLLSTQQVTTTPEPASLVLLGTGLMAILVGVRLRRRS